MKIILEIETHNNQLLSDMFELEENEWKPKTFDEGAIVRYESSVERLTEELPTIIIISLEILRDIAIGVVSAWLYDKIRRRAVTLRIEKTKVEINEGQIQRILIEKLEEQT